MSKKAIGSRKRSLTIVTVTRSGPVRYSLADAARLAGLQPQMVRYYWEIGLFGASGTGKTKEPTFDDDALYELRRFEHYRRYHGLNRRTLRLLSELWREVDRLRAELRFRRGL